MASILWQRVRKATKTFSVGKAASDLAPGNLGLFTLADPEEADIEWVSLYLSLWE